MMSETQTSGLRRAAHRRRARWGRFRRWGLGAAALGLPFAVLPTDPAKAQALPTGGNVVGGSGTISQTGANQLTINQNSSTLSIDWQSFSVGAGNIVRFIQPDSSSLALNRVIGPDPSMIFGSIQANGRVVIMNPAGIFFGPTAMVDVNGLVATTSRMNQADFLAGNLNFSIAGDVNARVINEGFVNVALGGFAVLSAAAVENKGTIVAQGGTVVLAGTPTFTLDFFGDGLLKFASTGTVNQAPTGANALVENSGTIQADGGRVLMTARAARDVINNVINVTGIVEARSARVENGEIVIDGGENGIVSVNATLDVSGQAADAKGGTIKVLGEKVGLFENARLDASGDAGGGTVLVGGNYQGKGPEANAKMVYMDARAVIDASSALADGGRVILWSDDATRNAGHIDVSGAVNGGFIEVSSKGFLDFRGTVGLQGTAGNAGTLLLDPTDITISGSASSGDMSGSSPFAGTNASSNLDASVLNAALASGDVTVTTASAGGGTGNIDVTATIVNAVAGRTLTLRADGAITIGSGGYISGSGYALNVSLRAGGNITVGGLGISTSGGYIETTGTTGSGLAGGSFVSTASINTTSGHVTLQQTGTISIGGTLNTSGIVTLNAGGTTTQTYAITGSGSLFVGGTGAVTLNDPGNTFTNITLNRTGTSTNVSLNTSVSPTLLASTLGTGTYFIGGVGFGQSGAITQDAGGGAVTIQGNTGTVTLSGGNAWTGALTALGGTINVTSAQTATGAGSIALDATRDVAIGANLTTATGDILIKANVASWSDPVNGTPTFAANSGDFKGVHILPSVLVSTSGGDIYIAGKGGTSASNNGVLVDQGDVNAGGGGNVRIFGAGPATGAHGVEVFNGSVVAGGAITMTGGNGAGGDADWFGIALNTATVSAGGDISLEGRGGANGSGTGFYLLNASSVSSSGGAVTIVGETASAGSAGVSISGTVSTSGAGALTISSAKNVTIDNSFITTSTGDLVITGNVASWSNYATNAPVFGTTAGNFMGVKITGGTDITSSGGDIAIAGKGGTTGSYDYGVNIDATTGNGSPISTTGGGNITIYGQGGPSTTHISGNGAHIGVNIVGNPAVGYTSRYAEVYAADGAVKIVGIGGGVGASDNNPGIQILGANVRTTGTGNVTVDATGGAGGSRALVLQSVTYSSTNIGEISVVDGNMSVTGTGGAYDYASGDGQFWRSPGITMYTNFAIRSTGLGDIAITGTGGSASGADGRQGVVMTAGNSITATGSGNISIIANSGSGTPGSSATMIGFSTVAGTTITSNGGDISIVSNRSIYLASDISSGGGDITLWGNAAGGTPSGTATSGNSIGVDLKGASTTLNAGGGNISIAGRGGDAGNYNHGILVDGMSLVTSGAGGITLVGTGGAAASGLEQVGVYINGDSALGGGYSVGTAVNAGSGGVSITGVGAPSGSGGSNIGVRIARTSVTSAGGNIAIGAQGGAGSSSDSIEIAGASVTATGAGIITLSGAVPVGTGAGIDLRDSYDAASTSITIGGGAFTGELSLRANSFTKSVAALSLLGQTGGTISFAGALDSTTIGINGGSGTLQIASPILSTVSGFSTLQFGSATQTGAIEIDSYTLARNTTLRGNTAPVTIVGSVDLGGNTLDLSTGGAISQAGSSPIVGFGDLVVSGSGGGTVALTDPGNTFDSVALNRGASSGNITISTTYSLDLAGNSGSGALAVSAPNILVSGALTSSGGSIRLTATSGVDVQENISTSGGDIVLLGNATWAGAPTGTPTFNGASGNFNGVTIGGGAIVDSGSGAIAIAGQGGDSAAGSQNGVVVEAGAQVVATTGTLAIYGKGGTNTGGNNRGVTITGAGSTVTGGAGGVTVVGTGGTGAGGYENHGVFVEYAGTLAATAGGTLQITGTGGATGTNSAGLYLNDGGVVSSTSGNVTITASAIDYDAVSLPNGTLSVGGAGTLTINASAPSATSVAIGSSGTITTGTGTTTLNVDSDISFTTGPLSLGGALDIVSTATSGGISIDNAANSIAGTTTIAGPYVNLTFRNSASNADLIVNGSGVVTLGAINVQGALTVNAVGAITQTGAISSAGLATFDADGAGNVTLDNLSNDLGHSAFGATVVFTNVNNATIWNANAIAFGTSNTAGMLDAKTASGGTSQATGATMSVAGTTALTVNSAGGFVFNNAGNDFGGAVSIATPSGWGGTIRTTNDLHLGTINVGGAFSAFAGSGIDQSGILSIGAGSSFASTTGTITLTNAGNSFGGAVALTAADNTAIASSGALSFNTVGISGTGNLTVDAGGSIAQTNSMSVAGTTTLTAGGGIDLSAGGNMFTGAVSSTSTAGGTIQLTGDALYLGPTVSDGNLILSATSGGITQSGLLTVSGNLNASATGGPVGLATHNNVVGGSVSLATSGGSNIAWSQSGAMSIGSISSSGTLDVSVTGGAVSQVGAVTTAGAASIGADTGNITLTNASNAFGGPLTLYAASGSASVTNAGALTIASIDVANSLALTAGGTITQSGAIQVGTGTTSLSATGTMTLSNSFNNFGSALALTGVGGTIVGTAPAVASVTAVGNGFNFNSTAIANSAPASSGSNEGTTLTSVTTETLAQIITQILTSTVTQPSSSTGPTDATTVNPVSPAAVQAMLIAILAEAAGPAGGGTGGGESNNTLPGGGTGTPSGTGATTPAVGTGTFAAGTTITINTSGGTVQSITVTPVGGGAPVTILPGLLNLTPPAIPTATATGTPGISGNFPLSWRR